jgi:hypothetical protein
LSAAISAVADAPGLAALSARVRKLERERHAERHIGKLRRIFTPAMAHEIDELVASVHVGAAT